MMAGKLILPGLVVALLLAALLWALAALHFYWGTGGVWPARDEKSLARSVVGAPGITRMPPPLACIAVAFLLAALGVLPLLIIGVIPAIVPRWLILVAGSCASLVFIGRGYAASRPEFRQFFPEDPFATLDRRYYAPLCYGIGIGFIFLMMAG